MSGRPLGWVGIARLGLVQAALGAIVVLTTSTLNRVMVVELRLAASVPGALVGLHYALQLLRPRWGHGADAGGRRTPWIVGGMAVLGAGGVLAAAATWAMAQSLLAGLLIAVAAFALIGIGVGSAGTALLTLLADQVEPERRPAAAAVVWITMIVGFIVTTMLTSHLLDPFSFARLVTISAGVSGAALIVTVFALLGVEREHGRRPAEPKPRFADALRTVWADPEARGFTWFIAASMLAYSAQDLILEPFAGLVFHLSPAQTTAITSLQNGGVLCGMLVAALLGRVIGRGSIAGMRQLTAIGCLLSGLALAAIALSGVSASGATLRPAIAGLGFANGLFAVSAVGLMMSMAGREGSAGVRMGVWGAAQAVAFGGGGLLGAVAVDAVRLLTGATVPAYAAVFCTEGVLFLWAAGMAVQVPRSARPSLIHAVAAE